MLKISKKILQSLSKVSDFIYSMYMLVNGNLSGKYGQKFVDTWPSHAYVGIP